MSGESESKEIFKDVTELACEQIYMKSEALEDVPMLECIITHKRGNAAEVCHFSELRFDPNVAASWNYSEDFKHFIVIFDLDRRTWCEGEEGGKLHCFLHYGITLEDFIEEFGDEDSK